MNITIRSNHINKSIPSHLPIFLLQTILLAFPILESFSQPLHEFELLLFQPLKNSQSSYHEITLYSSFDMYSYKLKSIFILLLLTEF